MHCGTNLATDFGTVLVHDKNWSATSLKVEPEMEVEILGVTVDLTNRWRKLRREIVSKTAEISLPLSRKRLSVETKRIAYEMVVLPTILYKAKFINLSIGEYESLLNPVNGLLRSINGLKRTTPEETLYCNHKTAAGLQLPSIVSRVQEFKIGMFSRAMQTGNPANNAAVAIIERCFRQQAINASGSADIAISEYNCSWYSSVLEWQSRNGTRLYRNASNEVKYASHQPIRELCDPQYLDLCDQQLARFDITIVRDLTAATKNQPFRQWFTTHPVVPMLNSFPLIPNDEPNILQIGKLYLSKSREIHEFCGWERETLFFREWKATASTYPTVHSAITLKDDPQCWQKHTEEFCLDLYAHVYAYGKTNKNGVVTSTSIWAIQPDSTPVSRIMPTAPTVFPKTKFRSPYRLFTDGAHRQLLSTQQIVFGILPCDLSELKVQNASGGVIYKNLLPVQTLTVTGFDHQTIPNSSSYEPEAIGLLAGLITLGKDALNVEAFTDSKALLGKLGQYKRKPSDEYVADHLIARLHELISQYHVNLTWVKGHPERRSELKRKDWSRQDIGIYIADQMTKGGVDDLPPLRFQCDHIQPTIIQFRELLPEITRSTRYQYRRADNVPLAEYQMRELHRQSTAEDYLRNREVTSLEQRKIKWTQLSIPLAVRAIETDRRISKPRVVKTVLDKYDDDLYKSDKYVLKCPLCQDEKDTAEHLYSCRCEAASAVVTMANLEQQRIPVPQILYEASDLSSGQLDHLRRTIIRNINVDSHTRIGMFNQLQQAEIVNAIPEIYGRDDAVIIFGAISQFLVQLLQPSVSATLRLIELRNQKKKELERSLPQQDAAERKTRKFESRNPFDFGFPEETPYVDPAPVSSYEIRYGSPSVTAHILARTPEDALIAVSHLTRILPSHIDIYSYSEVHPDTYVRIPEGMSTQRANFISDSTSTFSPLLSLTAEVLGGVFEGFIKYRAIRQEALHDKAECMFVNFIVRLERLIRSGHLIRFRDFIQRCSLHAEEAENRIVLRDIQAVQTSILHRAELTSEQLHGTLMWSSVAMSLRHVVAYALTYGITSGFSTDQMHSLVRSLPPEIKLPTTIPFNGKEIVIYHSAAAPYLRATIKRRCKTQPLQKVKTVQNKIKDCLLFHTDRQHTPKISTFSEISLPPHQSSIAELASFQANIDDLRQRYAQVSQQCVEERDTETCQAIISDSENLLTDDRLPSLSATHRKLLREKLRRAITQVRTIQQEATAYDSSQLPKANSILHFFKRNQPASTCLSRRSLDNKEDPD